MVEHQTSKPKVSGSSPGWSVDFFTDCHIYVVKDSKYVIFIDHKEKIYKTQIYCNTCRLHARQKHKAQMNKTN